MSRSSFDINEWLPSDFDWRDPDYTEIINRRIKLTKSLMNSSQALAGAFEYYKNHPTEFIRDWFWLHEPRPHVKLSRAPFIPFPKQIEFANWILDRYENQESGIVAKPRDAGASWVACAIAIWFLIFSPDSVVFFGSRTNDDVDKLGNPSSLFEKLRFLIRGLPKFFLPVDIESKMNNMLIKNSENNATILGDGGDNLGRSGRSSIVFLDEFAAFPNPEASYAAIHKNAFTIIYISTLSIMPDNFFNDMWEKKKAPIFTFYWDDDPRRDKSWLEREEEASLSRTVFRVETLMDLSAQGDNKLIDIEWIRAAVDLDIPAIGDKIAGLDVAERGCDKTALCIRHGSVIQGITEWHGDDTYVSAKRAYDICINSRVMCMNYDSVGLGVGIRGDINKINRDNPNRKLTANGVHANGRVKPGFYKDGPRSRDIFGNIKAQLWFELKDRFENTYKYVKQGKDFDIDKLISIPNDDDLIRELSLQEYRYGQGNKMLMADKHKKRSGGFASPNKADALVLSMFDYKPAISHII